MGLYKSAVVSRDSDVHVGTMGERGDTKYWQIDNSEVLQDLWSDY